MDVKRNPRITYIQSEIPDVSVHAPKGRHIPRRAPDTLDIAERARLAARAMTELTCPEEDYEMFFMSQFQHNPPYMMVTADAIACQYKYQESLPLVRSFSGYCENLQVDQRWKETLLQRVGPDGLLYWPEDGRSAIPPREVVNAAWMTPRYGDADSGQICQPAFIARAISAMTLYYREDGNPVWLETIRRLVQGLKSLSHFEGDEAWLIPGGVSPGAELSPDVAPPEGFYISLQGWMVQALAQYVRHHEDAEALAYACQLMNFLIGPQGMFAEDGAMIRFDHFHHHSQSIVALADLALVTGNETYKDWAWKTFTWARGRGDALVGFFPEGIRDDSGCCQFEGRHEETSETCEVADMIAAACKLADLGFDTWDDVERWTRNQFAENQMLSSEWVQDRLDQIELPHEPVREAYQSSDRVAERHVGAFAGWPLPNDLIWTVGEHGEEQGSPWTFMHCCTANGARALYYVWDHIVSDREGELSVQLWLNYSDPVVEIDSHVPYTGTLELTLNEARAVRIRLPEWAEEQTVRLEINGDAVAPKVEDRYLIIGPLEQGARIRVTTPLEETVLKDVRIGSRTFDLVMKGWEVVRQTPEGRWVPYYQRAHFRTGKTRMVERDRFLPEAPIRNW